MAAVYGKTDTYSNSTLGALHVSIEDLVQKYPAKTFPLLRRLDGSVFTKEVDNTKYEWKEETLRPTNDALAGGGLATTSATTVVGTVPGVFNVDDVIQLGSEHMVVTAVASDGITLTVIRGWASTTAATATAGATIYRIGIAAPEGKDADGAVIQPLNGLYNLTQIFEDVVDMSGTEEESFLYRTNDGNTNASNQITKKQQELMEMLQSSIVMGRRAEDVTGKRRTQGGLKYFIDTYAAANAVNFGGAGSWNSVSTFVPTGSYTYTLGQQKLDDLIQSIVAQRGKPTAIYAGYKAIRRMSIWNIELTRGTRQDDVRGFTSMGRYLSQAGDLDVVMVPGDALSDLIFVVDESRLGYKAFKNRGWFTERLAKTGDSSRWQILGEYTTKVSTPFVHGYMFGLGL